MSSDSSLGSPVATRTALIDISEDDQLSEAVDIEHYRLAGLIFPAMDGTALTFHTSATADGTFVEILDESGVAVTVTFAASKATALETVLASISPFRFLKFKSGTAETADRSITVVLKA